MLSQRRRLFRKETINLVFGLCDYTNFTVRPLALNFALGKISDRLCIVPYQYQGLNDVEIDRLGSSVIQRYFTHRFAIARHGIHYSIGIILRPSANKFFDVTARFQG